VTTITPGLTTLAAFVCILGVAACSTSGSSVNTANAATEGVVASTQTVANVRRVGILTDYSRLAAMPGGGGILCWRATGVDWKSYNKIMLERIHVTLDPASDVRPIDPTDLKMLIDYFHDAVVRDLSGELQSVRQTGPGVLRVRFALTSLVPTNTVASLAGTAAPYGFVAEIGSGAATGRPIGSTPYLGRTGMEAQLRDGASGRIVAECADTEIGLKYAADINQGASGAAEAWLSGYVDSFTSWSYAKDAFDKWASAFARRLRELQKS
jgi:hypothetical protein